MLTGTAASADLWGGRAQDDFEIIYERIEAIELVSGSGLFRGTHEIIIPDTTFGDFIVCQLFDADGAVLETEFENAKTGMTRVYMVSDSDVAKAICATTDVVLSKTSP